MIYNDLTGWVGGQMAVHQRIRRGATPIQFMLAIVSVRCPIATIHSTDVLAIGPKSSENGLSGRGGAFP